MLKYNMTVLGEPKKMLGMQFKYSPNRSFISILQYVLKIYHKCESRFTICRKHRTPMTVSTV